METQRSLKGFLKTLQKLNRANINHIDGKEVNIILGDKYDKELKQIQDLINSFDFVGPQPINKVFLEHPIPPFIKALFS